MKYSKRFERDYNFYIKNLERFSFCGKKDNEFIDKKGNPIVIYDDEGINAKEAFYVYESRGEICKTNEPELLLALHRCKASINLHINLWAEGRRDGTFPRIEWKNYAKEIGFPVWVSDAVENQMLCKREK